MEFPLGLIAIAEAVSFKVKVVFARVFSVPGEPELME
jgi:hypothetical protein